MVYLTLEKNLWIKVDSDEIETIDIIKERFSFFVDNYFFVPAYKSGSWDGKIKVFDYKNRLLPFGLLFDLIKTLKKNKIEIKASEEIKSLFGDGIKDSKFSLKLTPRYYQEDTIKTCLNYKKGLFISPTASGKSLVVSYIIDNITKKSKNNKSLIIVPTTSLILQFYDDLIDYGIPEDKIGKFYADEKQPEKQIIISTWQSLAYNNEKIRKNEIKTLRKDLNKKNVKDRAKLQQRLKLIQTEDYIIRTKDLMEKRQDLLNEIDCVIVDEVQTVKAVVVGDLLKKIPNAQWRFGCTGTLPKNKLDQINIRSFIGPVIKEYTVKELTDAGFLNPCEIHMLKITYRDTFKGDLNDVKDQLFENKFRQKIVNDLVSDNKGKNFLFLVNRIEKEGRVLEEHLIEKFPDYKIKYIHGKIKAKEREEWRKKCNEEENVLLIANYSLFQAGINIPSLSRIVLLSSFKTEVRILQSIGRSLRTSGEKKFSLIYDFSDNVKYIKNHARKRLEIYKEEEFEIKQIDVKETH